MFVLCEEYKYDKEAQKLNFGDNLKIENSVDCLRKVKARVSYFR
jgi:hypothetical protein